LTILNEEILSLLLMCLAILMRVSHQSISPVNKPTIRIVAETKVISPSFIPNQANKPSIATAVSGFVIVKIKPVAKSLEIE
jgi:hypothetical protein